MSDKQQVDVDLDTDSLGLPEDEKLEWSGLPVLRSEVVNAIINQQVMAVEMAKQYKDEIAKQPEVGKIIEGLTLSLEDLATKVVAIDEAVPVGKTGVAEDVDDKLLYLKIASNYINVLETVASITSSTHLEVHTSLSLNADKLKEAIKEVNQNV